MLVDWLELTGSPLRATLLYFPWLPKDFGQWSPGSQFQRQKRQFYELLYREIAERRDQLDPHRTDILTLMLLARDEEGEAMTERSSG